VLAVEECVAPDGDFPTYPYLASADFAAGRMTRRSLGCCAPNRISADWRSRVWLLGTTGLPVGLHFGKKEMLPIAAPKEIKDGKNPQSSGGCLWGGNFDHQCTGDRLCHGHH
jgi:hypothetical protein